MTPAQVIEFYGTQTAAAEALGLRQSAVSQWVQRGRVPMLRQFEIELLTKGELKRDERK